MNIVRTLGSFKIAVFLITSLLVLLIISTTFESIYGIETAQIHFYTAGWFDLFLSLFGINIFCATLSRWPFKLRHTGFIITHTGILLLLAGSLMSRLMGIEGQMTLFEDEKWNRIRTKGYEVLLSTPGNPDYAFDIPSSEADASHLLQVPDTDFKVELNQIREKLAEKTVVKDGAVHENAAAKLRLKSSLAQVNTSFWLIEENPFDPYSDRQQLGPALFQIIDGTEPVSEDKEDSKKAAVVISNIPDAPDAVIPLNPMPQLPYAIPGSDIQITEITYFDAAIVRENRLVNDPSDGRFNPAVEVTFRNESGFTEKHTKFFLFPDFESMHGKKSSNSMDLDVSLDVPVPPQHRKEKPGFIVRFLNGEWSYQVKGSKDRSDFIKVSEGDMVSTGWMDMQITIESLIEHAVVSSEVVPAEGDEKQFYGANLSLTSDEGTVTQWALPHRPAVFTTDAGPVTASVSISSHKLPFSLVLNDFRKVDYPGTREAMSFESDVTLVDSIHNQTISKTIKMNEPMDYAGFRIFQSSYIQDPEHGEASVFTIAKNPGLFFQYSGAIILTLGVLILFYVKPLSVFTRVHGDIK